MNITEKSIKECVKALHHHVTERNKKRAEKKGNDKKSLFGNEDGEELSKFS